MLRRDLIIFLLAILYGLYSWLILPAIAKTSQQVAVYGTLGLAVLFLLLIILIVLSSSIKKFGHWGDQSLFKKKKKDLELSN